MPRFEIKVAKRPNITVPGFTTAQMGEIGQHAIEVSKERTATATNVLDQPAKPLSPKYAERKIKKGRQPIRDIRFTGNTLGSMQVIEVGPGHVKVGIRGSTPFRKALFNQNIDPWFGLSEHDDQRVLNEKVRPLFSQNLADALK